MARTQDAAFAGCKGKSEDAARAVQDSATERLIDASLLSAMKPGALLVNAGRGPLVDQGALKLSQGKLRAALDVTDPEPLPRDNRLWSAPNLLLTPHIAGDTPRRYRRSWQLVAAQLQRLLDGEPPINVIKRDQGLDAG